MIAVAAKELPELATEAEVAEYLRLKPHTLTVWRSTGRVQLAYVKIGHLVRYKRADVLAYAQACTHVPDLRIVPEE